MENTKPRVTIHMAASLDGFIARRDGSVDWLETADRFEGGDTMAPDFVEEFLKTIDCYVMGSRTYETALEFEARGLGWSYGDKPTFVLTSRELRKTRDTVEFYSGELALLVDERLKPNFRSIWFVGGGEVCGECLRLGLADEVRYSIMPILIGEGISFFDRLDQDVALHLVEVKAYQNGMVALRYEVRRSAAVSTRSLTAMGTDSTDAAVNRTKSEGANRNLASISPFFIVKDLQVAISYYIERLGFQLDFQGPGDDPYYAGVSRDGIGLMLKAIRPDVRPQPNHTRHEWARWDAYIYTLDPDTLFDEFSQRGASFVKKLSFVDEGLWGFEVIDADGYVLAFFHLGRDQGPGGMGS